jgi:uncharacterized protein (TIRG00374 family)
MKEMSEQKLPLKKWVFVLAPIGFIVLLLSLMGLDLGTLESVVSQANWGLFLAAIGCVVGAVVFNALTWQSLLKNLKVKVSFRRVFKLSWVGIFVDTLVPGGWSGDIFKSYMLSKDKNVHGAKVAASTVLKNVLELFITLGALISGLVLLTLNYTFEATILLTIGTIMFLIALPLVVTLYLSSNLKAAEKLITGFKRIIARVKGKQADTSGVEGKLRNSLQEFHDGIATLKGNPRGLARPVVLQTFAWAFDVLALFLVFAALGAIVSPDKVVITNTLVVGLQTQGVALAGFAQVVSSSIYTALGIAPVLSVASTLLAGFATFWFKMGVSFVVFQRAVASPRGFRLGSKLSNIRLRGPLLNTLRLHKQEPLLLIEGVSVPNA